MEEKQPVERNLQNQERPKDSPNEKQNDQPDDQRNSFQMEKLAEFRIRAKPLQSINVTKKILNHPQLESLRQQENSKPLKTIFKHSTGPTAYFTIKQVGGRLFKLNLEEGDQPLKVSGIIGLHKGNEGLERSMDSQGVRRLKFFAKENNKLYDSVSKELSTNKTRSPALFYQNIRFKNQGNQGIHGNQGNHETYLIDRWGRPIFSITSKGHTVVARNTADPQNQRILDFEAGLVVKKFNFLNKKILRKKDFKRMWLGKHNLSLESFKMFLYMLGRNVLERKFEPDFSQPRIEASEACNARAKTLIVSLDTNSSSGTPRIEYNGSIFFDFYTGGKVGCISQAISYNHTIDQEMMECLSLDPNLFNLDKERWIFYQAHLVDLKPSGDDLGMFIAIIYIKLNTHGSHSEQLRIGVYKVSKIDPEAPLDLQLASISEPVPLRKVGHVGPFFMIDVQFFESGRVVVLSSQSMWCRVLKLSDDCFDLEKRNENRGESKNGLLQSVFFHPGCEFLSLDLRNHTILCREFIHGEEKLGATKDGRSEFYQLYRLE